MTGEPPSAAELGPIDAVDLAILDLVEDLYTARDPVPDGLLERIFFAIELVGLEDEVARLEADRFDRAGVRGTERSRTVTFDSESLTIVIQATTTGATVRVDGWLAPPGARPVRLRVGERDLRTEADQLGRFVLADVPHGLAQLIVEAPPGQPPEAARSVVTMAVML
ncbi:MAG TPA: hypothetical protein VGS97_12185 [Actinocrinis sp.]|uniref:hypothetical protein n=1 Tax=Actinocrinis sp. TaxID=1920516 RepID=UPI002DDD71D6|nr:hypothetical protein [Actinocrinis sp.]HEV2344845.1 hypothetical protein [Actinocrinis sp.]